MNGIELTDEERALLIQVLARRERDLEVEILHTDHAEFRKILKEQLNLLHSLMAKINSSPPAAIAA